LKDGAALRLVIIVTKLPRQTFTAGKKYAHNQLTNNKTNKPAFSIQMQHYKVLKYTIKVGSQPRSEL